MNKVKLTLYFKNRTEVIRFKIDNKTLDDIKNFVKETPFNSNIGNITTTKNRVIKINWYELIAIDLEYEYEMTLFEWFLKQIFGE